MVIPRLTIFSVSPMRSSTSPAPPSASSSSSQSAHRSSDPVAASIAVAGARTRVLAVDQTAGHVPLSTLLTSGVPSTMNLYSGESGSALKSPTSIAWLVAGVSPLPRPLNQYPQLPSLRSPLRGLNSGERDDHRLRVRSAGTRHATAAVMRRSKSVKSTASSERIGKRRS